MSEIEINEISELIIDEVSFADYQTKLFEKLDTIIEKQSDISLKLDTVIQGQADISYTLNSILTLAILCTAVKLLWTVVAKWLFGGI